MRCGSESSSRTVVVGLPCAIVLIASLVTSTAWAQTNSSTELFRFERKYARELQKIRLAHDFWHASGALSGSPLAVGDLAGHRLQLELSFARRVELIVSAGHWQSAHLQGYQLIVGMQYRPLPQLDLEIEGRVESFGDVTSGTTRLLLDYRLGKRARVRSDVTITARNTPTAEPPLISRGHRLDLELLPLALRIGFIDNGESKAAYLRIRLKRTKISLGLRADWSDGGDVSFRFSFRPLTF